VRRILKELGGGCGLHHLAQIHHRNTITEVLHYAKVVRNEEVREAELLLQLCEQVQHLRLNRDVECRDWLVQHDQGWVQHESASNANALPLAARELMGVATRRFGTQAHHLERLRHFCLTLL